MREQLFGTWGANLDDATFAPAMLVLGVAAWAGDSWREVLETWPEDKPLRWGSAEPPETWGRHLAPAEAAAAGAAFVKRFGARGPRIQVVHACARALGHRLSWVNTQLCVLSLVWFEIPAPNDQRVQSPIRREMVHVFAHIDLHKILLTIFSQLNIGIGFTDHFSKRVDIAFFLQGRSCN